MSDPPWHEVVPVPDCTGIVDEEAVVERFGCVCIDWQPSRRT